jgi:hypothetical protein
MGEACSTHDEGHEKYTVVLIKMRREEIIRQTQVRMSGNNGMDLKETEREGDDWTQLARDRVVTRCCRPSG